MSNREAKEAFAFVAHRDGRECYYKNGLCKGRLVLHHVDNNPENNVPSNWRILCRGHNHRLNPRGRDARHKTAYIKEWEKGRGSGGYRLREIERESKRLGGGASLDDLDRKRISSPEMEKNKACQPAFRLWVEDMIVRNKRVSAVDLINGGAEKVDCSQQATKKYLDRLCSITGRFQYVKDVESDGLCVEFRPEIAVMIHGEEKPAPVAHGKNGASTGGALTKVSASKN